MASASTFTTLTLFNVMLFGMLLLFGQTVPQFQAIIQGPVNCVSDVNPSCRFPQYNPPQITNTTNTKATPFPQCMLFIPSCFSSNIPATLIGSVEFVGYSLGYIGILGYAFLQKVIAGFQIVFLTGNTLGGDFGVPFFGNIVIGFFIINAVYGITIIRGNSATL
jgi:hypothetical protein